MFRWIKSQYRGTKDFFTFNVLLNHPELDSKSKSVFFLMNSIYMGFIISFLYGLCSGVLVWFFVREEFSKFIYDFFVGYNLFLTGGLAFSLVIQVRETQDFIPKLLSNIFGQTRLNKCMGFERHLNTFSSTTGTLRIVTIHIILSFILFYFAQFPYEGKITELALTLFSCSIFGCGVYVGRKIFYVALMLRAIEGIKVKADLFSKHRLDGISTYVNVITTFTVIVLWLHVNSFFNGEFKYNSVLGQSVKSMMFYPAILALPVLIVFNYYPRGLVRELYSKSIDMKLKKLRQNLETKKELNELEKLNYLAEMDKIDRDELKYRLRLAINDLPLVITIIIMIIGLLV